MGAKKYCVVTPYYKESRELLDKCMASVRRQGVATDHLMIADGFPQDWLDHEPVRHLKLDKAHADTGNTARGLGALLAVAEKYDGIAFLDADNWYDADHLETCLAAAAAFPGKADYVIAQRRFVRPDDSVMPVNPAEMPAAEHVDTNCLFFLPRSYHLLYRWCTIPQEMSTYGDRLFYYACRNEGLKPAVVQRRTVNYLCMFANVYTDHGEVPPPGAKPPVHWDPVQEWLDSLDPDQFAVVQRLTGLHLRKA